MSALCLFNLTSIFTLSAEKPASLFTYPISAITFLAISSGENLALVVISPIISTKSVVAQTSHATLEFLSCAIISSKIASAIWSHNLSGCPAVTLSLVKKSFIDFPLYPLYFTTIVYYTISRANCQTTFRR